MEVIVPQLIALDRVLVGSAPTEPVYIQAAWVTNTTYVTNDMVRYEVATGNWRDYRCKTTHRSSSLDKPHDGASGNSKYYWEDKGPSKYTTATTNSWVPVTNVRLSDFAAWTSGAAVAAGAAVWDTADNRDYRAAAAITAGNNTGEAARPSNAILSADEAVAARWTEIGASNAWAMLDYQLSNRLEGYTPAGLLIGPIFDLKLAPDAVNLIASPFVFSSGWTVTGGSVSADQRAGPDGGASTADDFTGNASNGNLRRAFTSLRNGARATFGVWLMSPDASVASTTIELLDSANVAVATTTVALTAAWAYFEVTGTIPGDGEIRARIGGVEVTSGKKFSAWGAHVGYAGAVIDRVALAGMVAVGNVTARVLIDGATYHTQTLSMVPTGVTHGLSNRTANLVIPAITAHEGVVLRLTLTRLYRDTVVQLGVVIVGKAAELAFTEWNVETSLLSFSRKERDEVFGNTKLLKRGNSLQTRATCFIDTSVIGGDVVMSFLRAVDGIPVFWDFNNRQDSSPTAYDNLRTFGFSTSARQVIAGPSWQSFVVDVEGLVE